MYLPDWAYRNLPIFYFWIGVLSGMMIQRSAYLTVSQILFMLVATMIIKLRMK